VTGVASSKLDCHFNETMRIWDARLSSGPVGLAVSGGSDSMALLYLMRHWAIQSGRELRVATVDHGLRPEAKNEVQMVERVCKRLKIPCAILKWDGWDDLGNLQNAARKARANLINEWAKGFNASAIATGHTADDQAETFLMRLARGSGVDGLSAMASLRDRSGVTWFSPLLTYRREELRGYLTSKRVKWLDDPSNENESFDRIKVRKARAALDEIGLTVDRLVETATRMGTARRALERLTKEQAHSIAQPTKYGTVRFDITKFKLLPQELRYRLFAHALKWVSGSIYRPRFDALLESATKLWTGEDHTLSGCHILTDGFHGEVCREITCIKTSPNITHVFDDRWKIQGDDLAQGMYVGPLGEAGLPKCDGWRELGASRVSLMGTPAIWHGDQLIAAPMVEPTTQWVAQLKKDDHEFFTSLVTH
jgi:tRNA(Ile)-lysidine synthase